MVAGQSRDYLQVIQRGNLQYTGLVMAVRNLQSGGNYRQNGSWNGDHSSYIAEDSTEFLEESRIRELLLKYNKFMPVPIKFGMKTETLPLPEGQQKMLNLKL